MGMIDGDLDAYDAFWRLLGTDAAAAWDDAKQSLHGAARGLDAP